MYLSRPMKRRRGYKSRADRVHSPGIPADIAEGLADLAETARGVNRYSSRTSDEYAARDLLNATLASLNERQVPIEELARVTGINHQAVRRRIENADPREGLFTPFPNSVDPHEPLGGSFHYCLTPTGDDVSRFTIREILSVDAAPEMPILRTPQEALDWLTQPAPHSITPVRTSGEILSLIFAIEPGDLFHG